MTKLIIKKRTIIFLLGFPILICVLPFLIIFSLTYIRQMSNIPTPDISDDYLIDISTLLGSYWQISSQESDIRSMEDLRGESAGVRGTISRTTRNVQNRDAFIYQLVIRYSEEADVYQRFLIQQDFAFTDGFVGATSTRATSHWENYTFSQPMDLNADEYRIACENINEEVQANVPSHTRCAAIFSYGNYIIYFNMWPRRDSITYLSPNQISDIVNEVDSKLRNITDIETSQAS